MKLSARATIGAALVVTMVCVPSSSGMASAQIQNPPQCPVVVDNTTLKTDCVGPLVVANSGVNLNLGGHTVRCPISQTGVGIDVSNRTNVHIENGQVVDCSIGIHLVSGGQHHLSNLEIQRHALAGLQLQNSDDNALVQLDASFNTGPGIRLNGSSRNSLRSLTLVGNGANNRPSVLMQAGSNDNSLQASTGSDSFAGVGIFGGAGNVVRGNELVHHREEGILLGSGATATTVQANRTTDNAVAGIRMGSGATGNAVQANKAHENGTDLVEQNANCDANVWKANQFDTTNQPQCVD